MNPRTHRVRAVSIAEPTSPRNKSQFYPGQRPGIVVGNPALLDEFFTLDGGTVLGAGAAGVDVRLVVDRGDVVDEVRLVVDDVLEDDRGDGVLEDDELDEDRGDVVDGAPEVVLVAAPALSKSRFRSITG